MFLFIFERERERAPAGEVQRAPAGEGKRESGRHRIQSRQAPGSEL